MTGVPRQCHSLASAYLGARGHQRPGQMQIPGHPTIVPNNADLIATAGRVRHLHNAVVRGHQLRPHPSTQIDAAMWTPVLEDGMEPPTVYRGDQPRRRRYREAICPRARACSTEQHHGGQHQPPRRKGPPPDRYCSAGHNARCPVATHFAPAAVNAAATAPSSAADAESFFRATTPASTAIGS